jgi:hypothetical protein
MSSSFRNSALVAGAVLAGVLVAPGKARASNWDFEPRVEVGGLYNDNYRLIEHNQPKVQAYGVLADVAMGFSLIDQRSELDIVPRVHSTFFPDDHEDQSTDGYFNVIGNIKTQKASYGGTFMYANETVLSSELLAADFPGVGLGQVQGEANGRVTIHNRRQLEQVAPKMTYDFSPRWHLRLNGMFENASFSTNLSTRQQQPQYVQIGFKDAYASAGMQYDLTQRQDIIFSLSGAKFMPDKATVLGTGPNAQPVNNNTTDTDRFALEAQWDAKPSTTMQTYVRLGIDQVHANTAVDGVINKTLLVGGAGAVWTYQLSQYLVDAIRDLSPSSAGAVVEHDELRFRFLRALRPRLYGVLAARGVRVRGASQTILGIQGSDYAAASASLQYQVTQNYRLAGQYAYTWQHFQGEPYAASNGITVSVIWEPQSRYKPIPDYNALPLDRPQ